MLSRTTAKHRPGKGVSMRQGLACLLILLLGGAGSALADGLTPQAGSLDLAHHSEFVVGDDAMTPEQVQAVPDSRWQSLGDDINLGYTNRPHWFRLQLHNPGERPLERLLELGYPMLDRIDFFRVEGSDLVLQASTGDSRPFDTRPIPHRNFVFPVTLAAEATTEFYFRIQTSGALQLPMTLWKPDAFASHSDAELALESMFYGVMLVMALFNLFLFFSLRERAYLFYVAVVSSTLVLMAALDGVAFQYLYPDLPLLHKQVLLAIVPLCQAALCLFARDYLEMRQRYPAWNRLFLGLVALAALGVVTAFVLPFNLSTRLTVTLAIPVALANLAAGVSLWARGDKNARLFSIAWMALLASVLLTVLNKLGVIPTSLLTEHGIPLGASAQALLFAFALADRFNRERRAYFREKQLALAAVAQQREAEAALLRASSHHELTGLPDRGIFERVVDQAISANSSAPSAVFMLHLQRFDDINKTLGHKDADQVLGIFAGRMNRLVAQTVQAVYLEGNGEQTKCVSHIEGVSFAFALQDDDPERLLEQAADLAERFARPVEFRGLMLELNFVIGASFVEPAAQDTQSLLRHAFIALDQTDPGGSNLAVYNAEMNPYSPRRLTLMTELREALRSNSLELHFQPQVHLESDRIAGFEALLRWHHPEHGMVPPDEFIPMAEQTGLIRPVTQWVIQEALGFCKALDEVNCDATVSVNISAMNLREPDFCDAVCRLLEANQVAARRLVLEVTETAAMQDPQRSLSALAALQAAKVRLSIDDFGTGHSSLAYIRQLPVNEIKIDRSFVMAMDQDAGDATIVRTTINMCHDLGYEVVAEGVENQATLELLRRLGCDYAQGYYLARPMTIDNALAWLQGSSRRKHSGLSA